LEFVRPTQRRGGPSFGIRGNNPQKETNCRVSGDEVSTSSRARDGDFSLCIKDLEDIASGPPARTVALLRAGSSVGLISRSPAGRRISAVWNEAPEETMTRSQLVRQLAEIATRPIGSAAAAEAQPSAPDAVEQSASQAELFVWFEDTSARAAEGARGMAGLPESLLPYGMSMRVLDRRYAEDHFHLLSAVRLRCMDDPSELIAALYTSALSVGTVAWIGTGPQYSRAWDDMYAPSSPGDPN
jgi:hypothetical protein